MTDTQNSTVPVGVYIAARFSRRPEANALANQLQEHGYRITSRWVRPEVDHVLPTGLSQQAVDSERQRFALEDMNDVHACDCMISLMEEPRSNGRGGRHVEYGAAVALGKQLIVIGPLETVFHHLPGVVKFDTVDAFLAAIDNGTVSLTSTRAEPTAYHVFWWDGDRPRMRVQLSTVVEPWLRILSPTITPLYSIPTAIRAQEIKP